MVPHSFLCRLLTGRISKKEPPLASKCDNYIKITSQRCVSVGLSDDWSVQTEISQQLFHGLPLNFMQTFMFTRGGIIITLVMPQHLASSSGHIFGLSYTLVYDHYTC